MAREASGAKRMTAGLLILLCILFLMHANADSVALSGYAKSGGYQYLEMGTFPQTLEGGREPILWRVLAAGDGTAYLLSEYVLLNHRLDNDDTAYTLSGGDFTKTEIFAYLNGEFLTHFTAQEQALMTLDGADGLFTLLSSDDLKNKAYGFTGDTARRGYPTPYAVQNGLFQYSNKSCPYWTRTQSTSHAYAALCTKEEGNLGYIRVVVQNEGLRPACRLRLDLLDITGGIGTLNDPYQINLLGGTDDE
ncbi:MAG: hypothetical protein JW811_07085 [Clostridiales bacterium]|nr:hypothetical protein [Clostridiales bacterium]